MRCRRCPKRIKILSGGKGYKKGLEVHSNTHEREALQKVTEATKNQIVAGLVTALNLPVNCFKSPIIKELFDLAKLKPINDQIARRSTDNEAE